MAQERRGAASRVESAIWRQTSPGLAVCAHAWGAVAVAGPVRGKEIRHSVKGGTGDAAEDQENRDLDTTIFGEGIDRQAEARHGRRDRRYRALEQGPLLANVVSPAA